VEGDIEMSADARELFATGDGCLNMSEAEGWVSTTVADVRGKVGQRARIDLSELRQNMQVLAACLEDRSEARDRPVDVFLGFTPEADQLLAAVTQHEMTIVEVSGDGVERHRLCGPYPAGEARRMADAVLKASTG
jgi:hypothetical protein